MLHKAAEGASGTAVVNRFGIAVHLEAHGGADVLAPVLLQRPPAPAADVDAGQRPRPGVEAGREDDDVEIVDRAVGRPDSLRRHALDRVVLDADGFDVGRW